MMTTRTQLLASLMVLAVAAAACGSPEPAGTPPATGTERSAPAAAPAGTPAVPPAEPVVHDGRKITLNADDTIKFDVAEIRVKRGERLSVTLINKGTMPKLSMGHNWVLLTSGTDPLAFVTVAAESPTTDYLPPARKADVIAATKLLGPGEQATVTFNAPAAPGRYDYLCSFPGHFQVGMRGVLIVE
jgi:azurin